MRLGFITLILRAESTVCNGTLQLIPPKKSIFWNSQGVIMVDYGTEGHKISGAYNAEELRWLCQEIVKKTKRGN